MWGSCLQCTGEPTTLGKRMSNVEKLKVHFKLLVTPFMHVGLMPAVHR
jgi:hypothetical protein